MAETHVLIDPGVVPFRGMRTAVAKALLKDGELALSQNFRHDVLVPTARGGTVAVFTLPTGLTGATVVDYWSGELDSVQWIVWAFLLNSKYELWASENGAQMYRISQVGSHQGGATGDTRFTTLTGRVTFQPVRVPRFSTLGVAVPTKDALIIANGTDYNLIWTPTGTNNTVDIASISSASPALLTTNLGAAHNLKDGDTIHITGNSTSAFNGSFWVNEQSTTTLTLYHDEALTVPVSGSAGTGGVINQPRRLNLHKTLTIPQDWKMFSQAATMRDYWVVAAAAATHVYATGGLVNQARWNFADSGTAPYNAGTNVCLLFTLTTSAAAGDIATFYMPGDLLNTNRAIGFHLEGTAAAIDRFFSRSKIEIGAVDDGSYAAVSTAADNGVGLIRITTTATHNFATGNSVTIAGVVGTTEANGTWTITAIAPTTFDLQASTFTNVYVSGGTVVNNSIGWSTIYDPSGTAEKKRKGELLVVDATNNRYFLTFPTDHITTSSRTGYHLRFIYDGAAPTTNTTLVILNIVGCGDIPGGATWGLSYEERGSYVESFGIEPSFSGSATFEDLGGPDSYTGGAREQLLPIDSDVLYDYALTIPNSQGANTITGGLNGEPSHAEIYLKLANEDYARFFYGLTMYAPGAVSFENGWNKSNSGLASFVHNTSSATGSYGLDESDRDPFRKLPSAWQQYIPPFLASTEGNSRLFVGNIYDVVNSKRQEGQVLISWKGNPFRMQPIPEEIDLGVFDDYSGNLDEYAGEAVLAMKSCAAQAQGRSMIHVVTSQSFNVQGYAGGFVGSADDAVSIGSHTRISNNGTNSARSVAENNGRIFWLDQFGQFVRYSGGMPENISRLAVDDIPKAIPSGRLDDVDSIIHKDRYYSGVTIAAGTTNARIPIFNDVMGVWESLDLPPVSAERFAVWYDTSQNGSGQRLLIAASTGITYEYDKAGQDDLGSGIACRMIFGEFMAPASQGSSSVEIAGVWVAFDAQSQTWTFDRYYRQQTGLSRSTCSISTGRAWDQGKPSQISGIADGRGDRGMAAYLDIYGTLSTGSQLWHVGCEVKIAGRDEAVVGN